MKDIKLNKIKDAIEAIKNGEIIIVVDDEKRENEGDFIAAAEMINSSMINFMAKHGRGLICVPMSENLCNKLKLKKIPKKSKSFLETDGARECIFKPRKKLNNIEPPIKKRYLGFQYP